AECGEFRYADVPYYVEGYILLDIDLAVWELRRYCQVLQFFVKERRPGEDALLEEAKAAVERSLTEPRYKFRIHGGLLEQILDNPKHPNRPALLWQNAVYGV